MQHSTDQVTINGRNFKLCHHSVIGSAYLFSYRRNSEFDIFCHSIGPRLHNRARIPLAHLLQSYDRLGIGPHLIPPTIAAGSQDITPCQGLTAVSTSSVASGGNKPRSFRAPSAGKQYETSLSNTHQCFRICTHLQTQGDSAFPA